MLHKQLAEGIAKALAPETGKSEEGGDASGRRVVSASVCNPVFLTGARDAALHGNGRLQLTD